MCPFRYRPRRWFSLGVSPEYMDRAMVIDDENEREFNAKYPRCWDKLLHWLGRK